MRVIKKKVLGIKRTLTNLVDCKNGEKKIPSEKYF
jgi:hypothetical protein